MQDNADVAALEGLTVRMAEMVKGLQYEDLPADVIEKAKFLIRDGLGNQMAASAISEPARRVVELITEWGGKPESTIVGYGVKVPTPLAAMCNAMMGHGVELDDAHGTGLIKSGSVLIPSLMAIAEAHGNAGKEVLTALVAGYEIAIRIAKAINPGHRQRGYHTTGTVSLIGAAAASAKLLGCSAEQIAWAMGLAAMQSAGIQSYLDDPCMAKPFSPGKSAYNGTLAAIMASRGFTGPKKALEGHEGFFNAYAPEVRVADIVDRLGKNFAIMEVGFKPHAACRYAHGPIDLAQMFYHQDAVRLADIENVTAHMSELSIRQASKSVCPNLNAAMGSTQFGVALALSAGCNGLRDYWDGFKNSEIHAAAANKISLVPEPAYGVGGRQAAVDVTLRNGKKLSRQQPQPKGEPANPLSAQELERKFLGLAEMVMTDGDNAQVVNDSVMRLEQLRDMHVIINATVIQNGKPELKAA
jgi:2-methylcitrate dehydratase PrpD